jgi:hypothetical protein
MSFGSKTHAETSTFLLYDLFDHPYDQVFDLFDQS